MIVNGRRSGIEVADFKTDNNWRTVCTSVAWEFDIS